MSNNLEEIFSRAACSNLTPTASEFVPRSTSNFINSFPVEPTNMNNLNGNRHRNNVRCNSHRDRIDGPNENNYGSNHLVRHYDRFTTRQNDYPKNGNHFTYDDRFRQRRQPMDISDTYSERRSSQVENHQRSERLSNMRSFFNNVGDNRKFNERRERFGEQQPRGFQSKQYNGSEPSFSMNNSSDGFRKYKNDSQYRYSNEKNLTSSSVFENNSLKHISDYKEKSQKDSFKASDIFNPNSTSGDQSISQRDRLIKQLDNGTLECLVCCDTVKQREPVWNCSNCYHVLHFWCVTKWARSSKKERNNWRCPACQDEKVDVPDKYICFCGKSKLQTDWNRTDTAHSCGEICGREKENPTQWFICEHRCTLLCHPGPCPPCTIQVSRECGCGRNKQTIQCSSKIDINCGSICDRLLSCGTHRCLKTCHFGECEECRVKLKYNCHCAKKMNSVFCGAENSESKFSCQGKCDRLLGCGNHFCKNVCHEGECSLCPKSPAVLDSCACGKTALKENFRTSCLDPVPTCDQICGRRLRCGPSGKPHTCVSSCHEDECPPCTKRTTIKCRCGALEKSVPCAELAKGDIFKCQKKCVKKRSCGKHKCNQMCCVDTDHICQQRCTGTMSCGKHRCELLCHRGKCGRCLRSSFEELYCHCRSAVIYPPVACGTKPPACDKPCRRDHDCDHPPLHNCHSNRECPPCIVFTDKLCYGGHELRKTIPCYQKEFSCGMPCGAPLPCAQHRCQTPCHAGACVSADKNCTQPCTRPRDLCGHACGAPCHTGPCPNTSCRESVKVTCACGNLTVNHQCHEHMDDYRRIISATLAAKMAELQTGNSVSISDVNEKINVQKINLRTLECNDECKLIMRNRRLALALQIQNPDLGSKLTPKYSDFMKSWAKKDPALCRIIHDRLTELVKLAKESKQKSRSYSFEVMNKEKRQLVHEYCAHFGCESEAYDAEPKRNVVAIAAKGRCWLPSYSVLEVVQREMGQRKVPIPVFNRKSAKGNEKGAAIPRTIILPVLPSVGSSHTGINYFGD